MRTRNGLALALRSASILASTSAGSRPGATRAAAVCVSCSASWASGCWAAPPGARPGHPCSTSVVVAARFALRPGDRDASEREIAEIVRWRREHQPGGSNAGSVFANPPGDSAGRLVEAAGLKGFRRGSAYVSPKHANFVQVDDRGSADDVRALIEEVARIVLERTGVRLELENHLVGFAPEAP